MLRFLKFLPLAYLAGVDGFVLFAPYLALTIALSHLLWARRRRTERLAFASFDEPTDVDSHSARLALS